MSTLLPYLSSFFHLPGVTPEEVVRRLREMGDGTRLPGMARYGIATDDALGVSLPRLRGLAKEVGRDHSLALALWDTGIHDARILASMVDEPDKVSEGQMESWVSDLRSWDLCDQCCNNLFRLTPHAWCKVREWCSRDEEFVRRAGFVLLATLAVHDRSSPDQRFAETMRLALKHGRDGRNYVKKAVSWALRQIGKRSLALNAEAIAVALELEAGDDPASRWIAADVLRELRGEQVRKRLMNRER